MKRKYFMTFNLNAFLRRNRVAYPGAGSPSSYATFQCMERFYFSLVLYTNLISILKKKKKKKKKNFWNVLNIYALFFNKLDFH